MAMQNNKSILLLLSVFVTAFLASACGGSGGDNNPLPVDRPGDLNPGLPGKIFFQQGRRGGIISGGEEYGAWVMDITTGKYTKIPNTDWANQDDLFPGNWDRVRVSSTDYEKIEFLIEVRGCKSSPTRTCFAIQDMEGTYLSQFDILGSDGVSSLISRNGQYIGYINPEGMSTSSDRWLEIYGRNSSTPLSKSKLEDRFIRRFVWLPDGRIIYSSGRSFYFTGFYSAESEYTLTLPDDLQGEDIGQFAVSPDGERLVFAVDGVPYIMDINGTDIRKLAVASSGNTVVFNIVWSPDAQWIILGEGAGGRPSGPNVPAGKRLHYAVPSEDLGKVFVLGYSNENSSPEVRILRRYRIVEENTDMTKITDRGFPETFFWIP